MNGIWAASTPAMVVDGADITPSFFIFNWLNERYDGWGEVICAMFRC